MKFIPIYILYNIFLDDVDSNLPPTFGTIVFGIKLT